MKLRKLRKLLLALLFLPLPVVAADFSTSNVQLLRGHTYVLGKRTTEIITAEHFSAWTYGDVFFFFDVTDPFAAGATSVYGEIVGRWSSEKIFFEKGFYGKFLKDISLSTSLEFSGTGAFLIGASFDFHVPFFKVFHLTPFYRDTKGSSGSSFQLTWVWMAPITVGPTNWMFEGFMDYATSEGTRKANLLFVPRLLFDIGALAFKSPNHLWVGAEFSVWANKFGLSNDEFVVQYMFKWVL